MSVKQAIFEKQFALVGFTANRTASPHFLHPIFRYQEQFFVQNKNFDNETNNEKIDSFWPVDEELDIVEASSSEKFKIGDKFIYCVLDNGGQLVYGEKDYLTRYLRQNLRNYINRPFFLKDVLEFLDEEVPELLWISRESDYLEAAALSSSIRRFCIQEISKKGLFKKTSPNTLSRWAASQSPDLLDEFSIHCNDSSTFFGSWLKFAQNDNPKLANRSRWSKIEKYYLNLCDDDLTIARTRASIYFRIASNTLRNFRQNSVKIQSPSSTKRYKEGDVIAKTQRAISINYYMKDHLQLNKKRFFTSTFPNIDQDNRDGFTGAIAKAFDSIRIKLRKDRFFAVELSMQIYFMGVLIRSIIEIHESFGKSDDD